MAAQPLARDEALVQARALAAAVCELDGCSASYCTFMRDGAYDESREVLAAQAGLLAGHRTALKAADAPKLSAVA